MTTSRKSDLVAELESKIAELGKGYAEVVAALTAQRDAAIAEAGEQRQRAEQAEAELARLRPEAERCAMAMMFMQQKYAAMSRATTEDSGIAIAREHYLLGKKWPSIAHQWKLSESTARARVRRALKRHGLTLADDPDNHEKIRELLRAL